MEDLKLRLQHNDINIRSRCILRLVNLVKKKCTQVIDSTSVQIPELLLLLENCGNESSTTSSLAVQAFVSLILDKHVDANYGVNKLLSSLNYPCNYYTVINGIALVLKFSLKSEKCGYSVLYPKHPFIAAMDEKSDCTPYVLQIVLRSVLKEFDELHRLMQPVFCYVICNPDKNNFFNFFNLAFYDVTSDSKNLQHNFLMYLLKYLPFLQVRNAIKVTETSLFLKKLSACVLLAYNGSEEDCIYLAESLLLATMSVTEKALILGQCTEDLFECLMTICKFLNEQNWKSPIHINTALLLIAFMMKYAASSALQNLVSLSVYLLEFNCTFTSVAAILALSVIHVLPESSLIPSSNLKVTFLKLLDRLEAIFVTMPVNLPDSPNGEQVNVSPCSHQNKSNRSLQFLKAFTPLLNAAVCCACFSSILEESDLDFKLNWLDCVCQNLKLTKEGNCEIIFSLVAGLFLTLPDHENSINKCFEALECILANSPSLSTRMFPLLLYKINSINSPTLKLLILNFLPKTALDKYSIPPILNVLNLMSKEPELKAQAIYLMLQLWKVQDRCFSQLYNLLTESSKMHSFDSGVNEVLIAQAAAIHEICLLQPEKYGHALLNSLSSIFNISHDEASLPVACLAIDGIMLLLKSEIIDIQSTWKSLSPKLAKDKRDLVICRGYKLLSLVPDLKVKSFNYDKFMSDTVSTIWKQISLDLLPAAAIGEAYKTLAKFPMDCYVLKQLPRAAKENLALPASMKVTPFDMGKLPEDVLTYIPGYCFTDLLISYTDPDILEGYTTFLQSLIRMEVEALPRSVYSQKPLAKRKNTNETLNKVPEFLCTQFQAKKVPALQKNLAVGVLLCYEPPLEYGKDGFPVKRSVATQSRSYEQVLNVLLAEVNIDAGEWQRCIVLSHAWASFLERAFFSCEEARRAELELQYSHGHFNASEADFQQQCKMAWLWVRDRFMGLIKNIAKNTPTSHANAIYAVSGLILASEKFYTGLEESLKTLSDESGNFVSQRNFADEYTRTIICAMYPDYQPSGTVHSWLLTHLSRLNSSASYLVRGCAAASLCNLVPVLTTSFPDLMSNLFQVMLQNITHSSPVLSFYSGKGFGLLVQSLCETGFYDVGEIQASLLLDSVKEIAKICSDSDDLVSSCLIALAFCIPSLSQIGNEDVKDWVSSTCNVFYEKLMDEDKSSMNFEMLSICVSVMIVGAVEGGVMPVKFAEDFADWFEMNRLESPQCSGISTSLGLLIDALERLGSSEAGEKKKKVLKVWFNTVTNEKRPTLHHIAALNGLISLFSNGRGLLLVKSALSSESVTFLNDLIPFMFKVIGAPRDTGLQGTCAWEVGHLYSVHSNVQTESSVPASYSYLGDKSILKPLMNIILDYQKQNNPDMPGFQYCHVLAAFKCLAVPYPRPLPPINWVTTLTPFVHSEDCDVQEFVLKISMYQSNSSSYASSVISLFTSLPLISNLSESCLKAVIENMPTLVISLAPPKLQVYLTAVISETVKEKGSFEKFRDVTLQALVKSLKLSGCKDQSRKILKTAFMSVFNYLKTSAIFMQKNLKLAVDGLLQFSSKVLESVLSPSQNDICLVIMMWCHLVETGVKPISSLRPLIEEGKAASLEQKNAIYFYIYTCFMKNRHNEQSELGQPSKCMTWLMETIGWLNVLEDSKSKYQLLTAEETYIYYVSICMATIVGCAGFESNYHILQVNSLSHESLMEALPLSISSLTSKKEWNSSLDKIFNWLLMLYDSSYLKDTKHFVKLSLCSLRSTTEYQKKDVWTKVLSRTLLD